MDTAKHENSNYVNDPHVCFLPLNMASLATHFALLSYDVNCIRSIMGLTPRFTKLVSFAVNGEFYFTSLLLGFPRRLLVASKPIFRLTARN